MATLREYFKCLKIVMLIGEIKRSFGTDFTVRPDLSFECEDIEVKGALHINKEDLKDRGLLELVSAINAWSRGIPPEIYAAHPGQSSRGALVDRIKRMGIKVD
jgi:hypothetical protein